MNLPASIEEILLRGTDDFIQAAEVAYIANVFGGAVTNEEIRHLSIEIIREVIENQLMKVGDLTEKGFMAWNLSEEDIIKRIDREWATLGRRPDLGELFWLANTENGNQRARQFNKDN